MEEALGALDVDEAVGPVGPIIARREMRANGTNPWEGRVEDTAGKSWANNK